MDKTIDWFLEGFMLVVWLSSVQLSSYLRIDPFISICNLALTRLYTYIDLYYAQSK